MNESRGARAMNVPRKCRRNNGADEIIEAMRCPLRGEHGCDERRRVDGVTKKAQRREGGEKAEAQTALRGWRSGCSESAVLGAS